MRLRSRAYLAAAVDACGLPRIALLQVTLLVGAVLETSALLLLVPLVQVLGGDGTATLPRTGVEIDAPLAVGALLVTATARAGCSWLTAVQGIAIQMRTADRVRLDALEQLLGAEWPFLARQHTSHIVQATTTQMERFEAALALLLHTTLSAAMLLATVAAAVTLSPVLGGTAALLLVLVAVAARRVVRRSVELGVEGLHRSTLFGAAVTDSLSSLRLVRAHDAAGSWVALLRDSAAASRRIERRFVELNAGFQSLLGIVGVGAALALVLLGRELGLGVPELIALAVVTNRAMMLARNAVQGAQAFAHDAPAIDAISEITRTARAHTEATHTDGRPEPGAHTAPRITLQEVQAGYGESAAFAPVTADIPAGSLAAVTGPSGAGKSTLLDVVLGLLTPTGGSVLADGAPLPLPAAWRARLAYVPQQPVLVPGSVRANLTWSAGREVDDAALWGALDAACVGDVVRRLPAGLDTVLHDVAQLSGGEQQRLCLARALVRRPGLLVLDEATNALDEATEARVLDALRATGATVVMATHRPSAMTAADAVIAVTAREPDDA
ncbi:MAG TPA: ABC transporter ATP-binding protein [Nocardioides sp.]|nr:ABC transporter ATP-binding protein [Nocardioides sp.]